jgi:hypothetical protein
MKSLLGLLIGLTLLLGCVKDKELVPLGSAGTPVSLGESALPFDSTGQVVRASGTFQNGVHSVSGRVRLYERNGQKTLVFTNFKSDTGPDLRIYLATDTQANDFTEVTMLTATGNFYAPVPASADSRQRYVLIWCKRFAVHFGNAELR